MTEKVKLPPLTQQGINHIDGTPDSGYVLRILQSYRENCNCMWSDSSIATEDGVEFPEPQNELLKAMNEHQRQRAVLLDEAIKVLGEYYAKKSDD